MTHYDFAQSNRMSEKRLRNLLEKADEYGYRRAIEAASLCAERYAKWNRNAWTDRYGDVELHEAIRFMLLDTEEDV